MDVLGMHSSAQQLLIACNVLFSTSSSPPSPLFSPIPFYIHTLPSSSSPPLYALSVSFCSTCVLQGDYLAADRKKALVPLKSTVEAEVRR